MDERTSGGRCTIVPPYLLQRLEQHTSPEVRACASRTLALDSSLRAAGRLPAPAARPTASTVRSPVAAGGPGPRRVVSDTAGTMTLPGEPVRREGEPATGDVSADEAYEGLGSTWRLLFEAYGRDSLDGAGMPLLATVHYGQAYDNAFWDGRQMVFGDGDGEIFGRFTAAVDVIAHELTHGLTELTAGLVYQGQSGALNESVSDVVGALVRQRALGQTADQADWLIGAGLFTEAVQGVALRSMAAPGTAYDDDELGKDPQPSSMAGYVETADDNGGVHVNSGIPNHAFYLAATALGGNAWERAGQVWYDVLTGGRLPSGADFLTFAAATTSAATARYGAGSAEAAAVASAWEQVGLPVADRAEPPDPTGPAGPVERGEPAGPGMPTGPVDTVVHVRRSGGVAGLTRESTFRPVELDDDDASRWTSLLASGVLPTLAAQEPVPDRFTYQVVAVERRVDVRFSDSQLPPDLRDLLDRSLRRGEGQA